MILSIYYINISRDRPTVILPNISRQSPPVWREGRGTWQLQVGGDRLEWDCLFSGRKWIERPAAGTNFRLGLQFSGFISFYENFIGSTQLEVCLKSPTEQSPVSRVINTLTVQFRRLYSSTSFPFSFCQIMLKLKISPLENPFQILENIENSSHSYVFIIRNMNVFESYCSEAAARGFISTKQTSFLWRSGYIRLFICYF